MLLILLIPLLAHSGVFGQFTMAPPLATSAPSLSNSFDPNCKDKMDNCWKMPESNCRAPYEDWAKQYCPNRCGYCIGPTTPAPPCVNKLPNCESYDKSVCTNPDYATWAGENCRYFCRMCSAQELSRLDSITTTIKPEDCVDKVDCRQYGANACSKGFEAWSKDNCGNYCGHCKGIPTPPPTCQDKIPNCKAYNPDTCTDPDYKLWVEDNCKKHCGLCPRSSGTSGTGPILVPAGLVPTPAPVNSGKDSPTIPYAPPSPPSPGKRSERAEPEKRQFHASHHHHGVTHDCWDGTSTDPYCNTAAPNVQETTPSSSIQGSTGFPGSEFHPHPMPHPDWDSKPSTDAPQTTAPPLSTESVTQTVKPPVATGHETPTNVYSKTTTTTHPTESTQSMTTTTDVPGSVATDTLTTVTDGPAVSSAQITTPPDMNTTDSQTMSNVSTSAPGISVGSTSGVSGTPDSGNTNSVVTQQPSGPSTTGLAVTNETITTQSAAVNTSSPAGTVSLGQSSPSVSNQYSKSTGTPLNVTTSTGTPLPSLTASTAAPLVTGTTAAAVVTDAPDTTPTTPGTTPVPCEDTVDNCAMYGKSACESEVYRPWAKAHCSRFCGFCVPVTLTPFECKDKLPNCGEFDGGDLCTSESYFAWARENCFSYCGFPPCGNNTGEKSTTVASAPVTTQTSVLKSGDSNCSDVLDSCIDYTDAKCLGIYEPWARSHCAFRCGYCPDFYPCEDTNPDCDKYPKNSCVQDSFKGWARRNCRKYCDLCARPSVSPGVTQPTGVNGTNATPEIPYSSVAPVMITKP